MKKSKRNNKGFSIVELLVSIAILSIIMLLVVQFMSTTSGAYQKNKKNLNLQTDSMQIMNQITDTIMKAKYIRIQTKDKGMYTIEFEDKDTKNKRKVYSVESYTKTNGTNVTVYPVDYDFVPDNYGNYALACDYDESSRKVIVDFDEYKLYKDEIVAGAPVQYPIGTGTPDEDYTTTPVRSFRALKPEITSYVKSDSSTGTTVTVSSPDKYLFVKPEYIYIEYPETDASGNEQVVHVCYYFTNVVDMEDYTCGIYMARVKTDKADTKNYKFTKMKELIKNSLSSAASSAAAVTGTTIYISEHTKAGVYLDDSGNAVYTNWFDGADWTIWGMGGGGRLNQNTTPTLSATNKSKVKTYMRALKEEETDCGYVASNVSDFYISADSDGNSILIDALFKDGKYEYHSAETVVCRNTDVLSVRPQKLLKFKSSP